MNHYCGGILSPLRIIILVILFYIGYRLIVGGRKKKSGKVDSGRTSGEVPANDTLEEDPVCKKLVPRQQAVRLEDEDKVYYFCSKECCKAFRKNNRR